MTCRKYEKFHTLRKHFRLLFLLVCLSLLVTGSSFLFYQWMSLDEDEGRMRKNNLWKINYNTINDPLGQTHISASNDQCFRFKFVLLWKILKRGDGHTYLQMDGPTTCVKIVITEGRPSGSIAIFLLLLSD